MADTKKATGWLGDFSVLRGKGYLSTTDLAILTLVATLSLMVFTVRTLFTPGLNLSAGSFLSPLVSLGHFVNAVVTLE